MPGVPTSRGCDACRKRKKKCDASAAGCSWCRQLNIPCVGYGQQRYIFKDEGRRLKRQHREFCSPARVADTTSAALVGMVRAPSNQLTGLAQAFVSQISLSIDINHQLTGNFGGFLLEVPRRIGTNEALDAAADTLIAAHARYCVGHFSPNTEILVKHSHALSTLRSYLNDPAKARTSETLCSVMLLSICEMFMSSRPRTSSKVTQNHYVGAAQMLKNRGFSGPQDDFERTLLLTLRGPVVLSAFCDSRIRFTKDEWQALVVQGLNNGSVDGDLMICMSQMPALMERARDALRWPDESGVLLHEVRSEMRALHDEYRPVLRKLRERWERTQKKTVALIPESMRMAHCHHSRMVAFGLSVGIIINHLRGYLEYDNGILRQDSARMSEKILELSDIATAYRPLGSMGMSLFLGAAWIGTADPIIKAGIEIRAAEFFKDIYGPNDTFTVEDLDVGWLRRFTLS